MKVSKFRATLWALFLFNVFFFDTPIWAAEPYKTGKQILKENPDLANKEQGFFIKVPIDYLDITKGTTEIYAHFAKPYNPKLPTYVLFTGGPGQSSHFPTGSKVDQYAELGYNFLLFDQRGIAFSRPDSEALWKNPDFYSSENNARDLEEIRKVLKIDKLSVYGASYGSVPATIYGHFFPNSVRAIVLEGVVFDGFDITPQKDNFLPNVIQKYFESLPSMLKEKLNRISDDIIVPKMWLPAYVQAYLSYSGTQQLYALTQLLTEAAKADDKDFLSEFSRLQTLRGHVELKSLDENLVHFILQSKEFGFTRTDVNTEIILDQGKIVRRKTGYLSGYVTEARNLQMPLNKKSTYLASNYPLSVPTYYINGNRDGATIPPWVTKHWKNVPQKEAYLFLMKEGGHMPGGQILRNDTNELGVVGPQAKNFFQTVFKKMLDGQQIQSSDIENFNMLGLSKFAFTSKDTTPISCEGLFRR